MRVRAPWPILAAWVAAAGCVSTPELVPPSTATTTRTGAPVTEGEGVRLVARGDAWKGNPSNLSSIVTPVRVRIENKSEHPLRIDYENFVLVGGSSFQYAALSPFQLRQEGVGGSGFQGSAAPTGAVGVTPVMGWHRGGGWHRFGGGWNMWGPGGYGPGLYDPFYAPYGYGYPPPEPLPTQDMTRAALPKGTLAPGGTITGFLYFQSVGEREGQVTLQANLVDATTGQSFGTLSIPFDVRS